jgi:hypothetical protein
LRLSTKLKRRNSKKLRRNLRRSEKSRKLMRSKLSEGMMNLTARSSKNPKSESSQEAIQEKNSL